MFLLAQFANENVGVRLLGKMLILQMPVNWLYF